MGFHSFDLQSAIFSTLSGDSSLDSKIGDNKIFDTVAPQDTAYPYVVIGHGCMVTIQRTEGN